MKKRIVFATGNAGKMKEIKMILGDLGMPVVSMKEAGIEADIVEDGTSFAENAQIKASAVFEKCHDIVLADDSGLMASPQSKKAPMPVTSLTSKTAVSPSERYGLCVVAIKRSSESLYKNTS